MGNLQFFLNLLLGHLSFGLGQVPKQVGLRPGEVALPQIHVRMGSQLEGNLLDQHADFVPIAFAVVHLSSLYNVLFLPIVSQVIGFDLIKCVACYM